jgi:hypothetical protein
MRTITLVDAAGQPLHSRHVPTRIYASACWAKVAGDRIVAVYAAGAKLPDDRAKLRPISDGVVRLD